MPSDRQPGGKDRDERVSLYPLDPITALKAALQVDPKSEPMEAGDEDERRSPDA